MNGYKKVFRKYKKGFYGNGNGNKYNISKDKSKQNYSSQKSITSHDFCGKLEYVKTLEDHNQGINNIIALDNSNYLTSDINEFYIRTLQETNTIYKENFGNNSQIKKIIYSSGKIIFSVEYYNQINGKDEKGISHKIHILVLNDIKNKINNNNQIKLLSCNTNDNPIDILESDNIIITVGKNCIELFQFNENNINNQLMKVSEILFNNNNDERDQILCVHRLEQTLICGHASGHISIWEPINEYPFLKNKLISKIHIGPINKIICDKNSENLNIIISCSSDKTVKIHSIEDTICFKVLDFEDEVIDIKKLEDLEKKTNYIISLKNGILKVYNSTFKEILDIPSRSNTKITRFVLELSNSSNNNNDNDEIKEIYILVTEANKIDIYKWNKKGEIIIEQDKKFYNNKKNFSKKFNNKYY